MIRLFDINLDLINIKHHEKIEIRKDDTDTNTLNVTVTNRNKPFNLAGWRIVFESLLADGTYIRDKGDFNNIKVLDAAKGKFSYTFIKEALSAHGNVVKSYFAFEKDDPSLQSKVDRVTTKDFRYKVISDALTCASGVKEHYLTELEKLIKEIEEAAEEIDVEEIMKRIKEIEEAIGKVDFVKRNGDTMTGDLNFDSTKTLKRITSYDGAKALFSLSFANSGMFFAEDRQNQNFNVFVYDPAKKEFNVNANSNLLKKTEIYKDWVGTDGRPKTTANGTDLDTLLNGGIYQVFDAKNAPVTGWLFVEVKVHTSDYVTQTVTTFTTKEPMKWERNKTGGNWNPWAEGGGGNLKKIAPDPMTHLNNAKVLTRVPTKQNISGVDMWLQGVNVNDNKEEVYVAYVDGNGTKLRVEIFDFKSNSKGQRTFTTPQNSYTESLPYWYNSSNQLHFLIRLTSDSKYHVLNFDAGTTAGPFQLQGRRTIAVQDGDRMITVKENPQGTDITGMYIYDWLSVKNGQPKLLGEKNFETTSNKPEKTQGVAQLGGYTFLCQGEWKGHPHLTAINNTGKIQNVFRYSKRSLAEIINAKYPGAIPSNQMDTWEYESEGGCTYQGRLVTTQVAPDWGYLFVHNWADGTPIVCEPDSTQAKLSGEGGGGGVPTSMWYYRSDFNYNPGNNVVKHDREPKWTQGKVPVTYDGTYYKTTADGMYDMDVFLSTLCKGAAAEHTIAIDFIRDSDNSVVLTTELDSFANGYENRYARLYGKMTWWFEKDTRFRIMYKNNDNAASTHYETRVTIKMV
ncbi:BppU family phage baseplate upper protein [Bacillus sp. COPE52]|uniref:BppU family phage baseplate upper protein n=1 Tax=Bacillus sp. COPE52 TaxID=2233998 RepID=UPI000E1099AE|nr:BppU family phage baseplate upper protein [Bacillus sp. COPE52]AXK19119.1 DUF2479 domain-containing protein [Bacillus sp. COPE52]